MKRLLTVENPWNTDGVFTVAVRDDGQLVNVDLPETALTVEEVKQVLDHAERGVAAVKDALARASLHPALVELLGGLLDVEGEYGWWSEDLKTWANGSSLSYRYHLEHDDDRGGVHLIEGQFDVEDGQLVHEGDVVCSVDDPDLVQKAQDDLQNDPC